MKYHFFLSLLSLFLIGACSSDGKVSESTPTLDYTPPAKGVKGFSAGQIILNDGQTMKLPSAAGDKPTLFALVRHAEKESKADDAGLTPLGRARAQQLKNIFKQMPPQTVLHSAYKRTTDTAKPATKAYGAEELTYHNEEELKTQIDKLLQDPASSPVLIVGHSNDIPVMLEYLTGQRFANITENNYSMLYLVSATAPRKGQLLEMTF